MTQIEPISKVASTDRHRIFQALIEWSKSDDPQTDAPDIVATYAPEIDAPPALIDHTALSVIAAVNAHLKDNNPHLRIAPETHKTGVQLHRIRVTT